jgi:hypothetical protein
MMIQNYSDAGDNLHYESVDQWACPRCSRYISSAYTLAFNSNNCSCSEVGYTNSGDSEVAQVNNFDQQSYGYSAENPCYNGPQSYASSSFSSSCPEGPERKKPNIPITNSFLPLSPDPGLNETEHRNSISFQANMSLPMRRFLIEEGYPHSIHATDHPAPEGIFLNQDIHILSLASKKVHKGSKLSCISTSSGAGSGRLGFYTWDVDPVKEVGAWAEEVGNERQGNSSHPPFMSGIIDSHFGEEN